MWHEPVQPHLGEVDGRRGLPARGGRDDGEQLELYPYVPVRSQEGFNLDGIAGPFVEFPMKTNGVYKGASRAPTESSSTKSVVCYPFAIRGPRATMPLWDARRRIDRIGDGEDTSVLMQALIMALVRFIPTSIQVSDRAGLAVAVSTVGVDGLGSRIRRAHGRQHSISMFAISVLNELPVPHSHSHAAAGDSYLHRAGRCAWRQRLLPRLPSRRRGRCDVIGTKQRQKAPVELRSVEDKAVKAGRGRTGRALWVYSLGRSLTR
ncbi:hypothetical protein LY76DRAFT_144105 [Colletotrichum caudatum]|nr:hypothetical protein LY76DRAFT_144105 [Colletotrichum caudatum]